MRGAKQKEMFEISDLRRRQILHLRFAASVRFSPWGKGEGGGTLIFSYSFFFRKLNIFGGLKILWIFLGGYHKIGLYLEVIYMHFRVFF